MEKPHKTELQGVPGLFPKPPFQSFRQLGLTPLREQIQLDRRIPPAEGGLGQEPTDLQNGRAGQPIIGEKQFTGFDPQGFSPHPGSDRPSCFSPAKRLRNGAFKLI
jgi:hypothetical protein